MAYDRHLDVGSLILGELNTRLTMHLVSRGRKDRLGTEGSILRKKSILGSCRNMAGDSRMAVTIAGSHGCRRPDGDVTGSSRDYWWWKDGKRFNGGSHIRFKAQLSTKFSDYKIMLKICEIAREKFKTYSYPVPDMRSSSIARITMAPGPVAVQTQAHPQEPTTTGTISSQSLDASKPTASSSQKDGVIKKKKRSK
ncbi:hypothetical protein AgCh_032154 [Apium graveolens]